MRNYSKREIKNKPDDDSIHAIIKMVFSSTSCIGGTLKIRSHRSQSKRTQNNLKHSPLFRRLRRNGCFQKVETEKNFVIKRPFVGRFSHDCIYFVGSKSKRCDGIYRLVFQPDLGSSRSFTSPSNGHNNNCKHSSFMSAINVRCSRHSRACIDVQISVI